MQWDNGVTHSMTAPQLLFPFPSVCGMPRLCLGVAGSGACGAPVPETEGDCAVP